MASMAMDFLIVLLKFRLVQHVYSIFITVMTGQAFATFHMHVMELVKKINRWTSSMPKPVFYISGMNIGKR
jgi:hypothetical protein